MVIIGSWKNIYYIKQTYKSLHFVLVSMMVMWGSEYDQKKTKWIMKSYKSWRVSIYVPIIVKYDFQIIHNTTQMVYTPSLGPSSRTHFQKSIIVFLFRSELFVIHPWFTAFLICFKSAMLDHDKSLARL